MRCCSPSFGTNCQANPDRYCVGNGRSTRSPSLSVCWLDTVLTRSILTWRFESLWQASRDGLLEQDKYSEDEKIVGAYRKAIAKGMLKVMAKMGISTLASYKGAQIFEALGLKTEVINRCFAGTNSRIQGCSFDVLAGRSLASTQVGLPRESIGFIADVA